jgi:hypothetical protein
MSSRAFLILIATIVVMIALFYTTPSDFDEVDQGLLLPNLKASINDVDQITFTKADNELVATLQRGASQWTVAERSAYPANLGKIRSTLIALAEAEIIEAKTADPARYDRLGVQDIDQPDASGTLVDISWPGQSISLIVGNTGVRGNMAYVREVGSAQSFLVSADLELDGTTTDWLDRDLLDISSADVHTVTIKHPDGDLLSLEKASREATTFNVLEIPDGRELSYASIADPIGGLLTALTLDDVEAATTLDLSEVDPVMARFETFDALVIEAYAYQLEDVIKVRFRFTADESLPNSLIETDGSSPDADADADADAEVTAFSSSVTKADELNAKFEPWIFTLPSFKSDQLIKKMEDLLK